MKLGVKYKVARKTNIIVLMLITVIWTGCAREQEILPADGTERPIVFGSVVSAGDPAQAATETRAKALSGVIPDGSSFGIAAYRVISSTYISGYMTDNTEVERNGSKYVYSPVATWPTGSDKIKFFAYYPYVAEAGQHGITVSWGQSGLPFMSIDYTLNEDPSQQQDLLYTSTGDMASSDAVALTFHHALTRVSFEANVAPGGYASGKVKVTGLRLKNVVTKGTLTVDTDAEWEISPLESQKKTIAMTAANGLDGDMPLTGTMKSILTEDGTGEMLLLPQSLAGVELEVDIVPGDDSHTLTYTIPLSGDWEMNGYINYQLAVSPSGVTLTAQVKDWAEPDVVTIIDGQYYMTLSRPEFTCAGDGTATSLDVRIETNHPDGVSVGYPDYGTPMAWFHSQLYYVEGSNRIVTDRIGQIGITASARSATIAVNAGNMHYTFHINQTTGTWITRNDAAVFPLDGDVHSFYVDSDYPWEVSLGTGSGVSYLYTHSGGKKNNESVVFITDLSTGGTQYQDIIFNDPENIRPSKTITLEFN